MTIFAFALVTVIGVFVEGFVLTMLWYWFVVPTFDLPTLSLAQAIGLMLVVTITTSRFIDNDQNNKKSAGHELIEGVSFSVGVSLVCLVMGFVVKMFL